MSRVEEVERYEYMTPQGDHMVEIHERIIREVPKFAASPEWNARERRRAEKRASWWRYANLVGRTRKEKRSWFRRIRREYGG